MTPLAPTTSAPALDRNEAEKVANAIIAQKTEIAGNVADYRKGVEAALTQVKGIQGVEESVEQVLKNMDEHGMAQEFGDVEIDENLGAGVNGINYDLSEETAIADHQLEPEQLRANPEETAETLSHERSPERGHTGQTKDVRTVIDAKDDAKAPDVQLEGEDEANQGLHFRGDPLAPREGQPAEVYGDGQKFMGAHHAEARAYVRKDGEHSGDAVWFQTEVLKSSQLTPEQMYDSLKTKTDFTHGEIFQVITSAKPRAGTETKTERQAV